MKNIVIILIFTFSIFYVSVCQKTNCNYLRAYTDSSSEHELYGYKNFKGEIEISAKYDFVYTDRMYDFAIVSFNNKWIGINRKEQIILEPYIFDNGPDYAEEGLFRFVEYDKIGFANLKGEKVISANFDFASPFKCGMARINIGGHKEKSDNEHEIWVGGLWGYINKKGKIIIKPTFINAGDFENGMAEVETKKGNILLINKKGKYLKKRALPLSKALIDKK